MTTTTFRPTYAGSSLETLRSRLRGRGLWLGLILVAALAAFEVFNFSTTEYALTTLFGEHSAFGLVSWAAVLAVAFCGIDFAGLSRLFTPESGRKEPKEVWLLTGAWFLGASMNAIMTWWAVGSALAENPALGNELVSREQVLNAAPVFIAALVWLTRILIIGAFGFAGDHLFTTAERRAGMVQSTARPAASIPARAVPAVAPPQARPAIPEPRPSPALSERQSASPLPTFNSTYARAADAPSALPRRYDPPNRYFGPGAGQDRGGRASVTRSVASAQPARPQTAELEYVNLD